MQWFDELDLDPTAHPVSMGTRKLGTRPWLVTDDKRDEELALKHDLLLNERSAVLHVSPDSTPAAIDVLDLISRSAVAQDGPSADSDMHPLEAAARTVQEDLVLLDPRPAGWHLNSAALCFPTRWSLADKVDRHISAVHGPVREYDTRIADRVNRLFDQLTERPVWRRNWFLMSNPALFQPYPTPIEHVPAAEVEQSLWIRSERQTLRQLPSGWILFTIRIQQALLSELLSTTDRVAAFTTWVHNVPVDRSPQRHLFPEQRAALADALAHHARHTTWPTP